MKRPDFARCDLSRLADRDLRFIAEKFPAPGANYEDIARCIDNLPSTLESILNSDFLFQKVCGQSKLLLEVSPFLLFNVLLRHSLTDHRQRLDRKIINYLANLLSLFVRTDRLFRVHPDDPLSSEYLVDLISESTQADSERQFLIYTHIGNYSLFVTGLFPRWIEHRQRFQRRPVGSDFYVNFGRTYFRQAAGHRLAQELALDEVFFRLAMLFDSYRGALNQIAKNYLSL